MISPGAVDTNIIDPAVFDKSTNPMLDPKDIADAAEFILSTPPAVQVTHKYETLTNIVQ